MSATGSVRVMLVEDHAAFRQALAFLLDQEPGIEVVAQSGSLAEAREALIAEGRLDVAVLDLSLPDGDGSELIGELRRRKAGVSVVVLSEPIDPGRSEEVSGAGASAVLDKSHSPSTIAREVRHAGRGG